MSEDPYEQARRARANRNILIGAIFFAVGLLITIGTYHSAASSRGGGTYIIAWGPMLFGFLRMIRGIMG